jgi:hypothetical protein
MQNNNYKTIIFSILALVVLATGILAFSQFGSNPKQPDKVVKLESSLVSAQSMNSKSSVTVVQSSSSDEVQSSIQNVSSAVTTEPKTTEIQSTTVETVPTPKVADMPTNNNPEPLPDNSFCSDQYHSHHTKFYIGDRCYVYSFGSERYSTEDTYPIRPTNDSKIYTKSPDQLISAIDRIINDYTTKINPKLASRNIEIGIMTFRNSDDTYNVKLSASDPVIYFKNHPQVPTDFYPVFEYNYSLQQEHTGGFSWYLK